MSIFDLGPVKPQRSAKPQVLLDEVALPPGAEGDPRIEPELARYAERYRDYLRQMETFAAERAAWEKESGGGAVEISSPHAGEMVERGRGRYVTKLPEGVTLGPRSGTNRVIHS